MILWTVAGVFTAVAVFAYAASVFRDWRKVRWVLARFASGDYHPAFGLHSTRWFRGIFSNLRRIAETHQLQNRQSSEEGLGLQGILAGMTEGVLLVDSSLRVRMANGALLKIAGLSSDPASRPLGEIFFQPALHEAVGKCIQTACPSQLEIIVPKKAGDGDFCIEVRVSPMTGVNRDVVRGAILVFHDVTRVRRLEATRREFVANVSHEFRTPLSIINGYIETLQDGAYEAPEEARQFLGVMHRHCTRLNLLIEDLLTISQLEHQAAVLELRPVDLRVLVGRVIEGAEEAVAAAGARVTTEIEPGDLGIRADPWRIEQALSNLLMNALRYGAKDNQNPMVIVRVERAGGAVEITVQDHGPGIPIEDQPRIFERFYRVHKDRSRNAGGTGLGLSIVRNIVAAHGGESGVRSVPGEGAAFWIRLPIEARPADVSGEVF